MSKQVYLHLFDIVFCMDSITDRHIQTRIKHRNTKLKIDILRKTIDIFLKQNRVKPLNKSDKTIFH